MGQLLRVTHGRRCRRLPRAKFRTLDLFTLIRGGGSRPTTRRELQRTRVHLEAIYAELRSAIAEEVRQREGLEEKLVGRIITIGSQFDKMESLAGRIGELSGQHELPPGDCLEQLRSELAHTTSAMADKLQTLEANVMLVGVQCPGGYRPRSPGCT